MVDDLLFVTVPGIALPQWAAEGGVVYGVGDLMSQTRCDEHLAGVPNDCDDIRVLEVADPPKDNDDQIASHAALLDPVRVLAECGAKRRIVELHAQNHVCSTYDDHGEVDSCTWVLCYCSTLQLLALSYADHPDYREEWGIGVTS